MFKQPCYDQTLRVSSSDLQSGKFTDAVCSFSQGSSNEVFVRSYCDLCIRTTCPAATECRTPKQCNPATGKCDLGNKPYPAGTPCTYRCTTNTAGRCAGGCGADGTCKPFPDPRPTRFQVPVYPISPGVSNAVAAACPDLQCLPGIDLSRAHPDSISGVSVRTTGTAGSNGLFSILPIGLLANINRFMFGVGKPGDPRTQCAVPVLSGAKLKAFKVNDVEQGFWEAVSAAAKLTGLSILKSSFVNEIDNQGLGVCEKLPIETGSILAKRQFILAKRQFILAKRQFILAKRQFILAKRQFILAKRQFIWGALGTMQLQVVLDVLTAKYPWFQSAPGKLLSKMFNAVDKFAVCAALNPCTSDYLFAFTGFGANFSFPLEPPLTFDIKDAGVNSIGWSSGNNLQTTVSAWDPLDLYSPYENVHSIPAQSYQVNAVFRIELGAKLGVGLKVPMADYVPSLASKIEMLSVMVMTDVTGLVSWGSASSGTQLLIRGQSGPLYINLADIISIPTLGVASAFGQKLTLYGGTRSSNIINNGFVHVWLQFQLSGALEVHFVAVSNSGYHVAFKAGVAYSEGLAQLVNRIPGLQGLTVGTVIDVGMIVTRHNSGQWEVTIKAFANARGKSYGGMLILDCSSWLVVMLGGC
ncbi:hypothetical protein OEZ86_007112 [Tetradesmus obliquus]|nr:hypothetical protein OEZ86_007112 [Tetradesmus obliquus]